MAVFIRRVMIPGFLFLFGLSLLEAQHAPGTKWMQRETDQFLLIYPDSLSEDAAALSLILDDVLEDASSRLTVSHPKKKWPLVLTDLGLDSNGFVSLAPRRSVWYAAPAEEFTSVSDWWMLLARHEARHMAQFDAADQGSTRFLRVLFGDYGWGAGIVLGTPNWLLEGDAVVMETVLSEEGRGRDPLFTREMASLVEEQRDVDYHRAANPSYRRHIPNHYYLGYAMASWIRQEYGSDALEEVYRSSARIPLPVIGINTGMKKSTGKKPREIYREMAADLIRIQEELSSRVSWTAVETISRENRVYSEYDSLFDGGEAGLFARKSSLAEAPALVRIDAGGREKKLMRLPEEGDVSMTLPEADESEDSKSEFKRKSGLLVAWSSIRRHPVYLGESVSDISIARLDTKGRVRSRRHIITGSRYQYPALSPDGSRLALVHLNRGGGSRIDILDMNSGRGKSVLSSLDLPVETAAYPAWSSNGRNLAFTLRSDAGRRIVEWTPGTSLPGDSPKLREILNLSRFTVKRPVYSRDGSEIFYSSNRLGTEDLWSVSREGMEETLLARRPRGITFPIPSETEDSLYAIDYSSLSGDSVVKLARSDGDIPYTSPENSYGSIITEENPSAITRDAAVRDPEHREEIVAEGEINHPESRYRPAGHGLNVHSWGILPRGSELNLFMKSTDVLGTLDFEIGALYEVIEGVPGAYAQLFFTGMRPVLGIRADYKYRSPRKDPFHQTRVSGTATFPMNLSRSGIWDHSIEPGIEGGMLWFVPAETLSTRREGVLPYIGYSMIWQRLREGSYRAFRPDLGWILEGSYAHIPLSEEYGDSVLGRMQLYLPGGFRNTSLQFSGGLERLTEDFSPQLSPPRGYEWDEPETSLLASVDYEFPLGYPDWPIGSVIFIQRFRLGLFGDFGFSGTSDALGKNGPWERKWSTGATLTMDFSAFNAFPGFNIGIRFSWLWQEAVPRVDFMIMELDLF